jgi:hypothetical protein
MSVPYLHLKHRVHSYQCNFVSYSRFVSFRAGLEAFQHLVLKQQILLRPFHISLASPTALGHERRLLVKRLLLGCHATQSFNSNVKSL